MLCVIEQALPSLKHKVNLTGFSVPVDSGSVIDVTCEFEKPFANTYEFLHTLRHSPWLKKVEDVHCKSQPGWLMQRWCPEAWESQKSTYPLIECNPDVYCNIPENMFSNNESANSEQINRKNATKTTSKNVSELQPIAPCFFKEQAAILPTPVAEFWDGDHLGVSADVRAADSMMTVDTHYCISLPGGKLMKIISW